MNTKIIIAAALATLLASGAHAGGPAGATELTKDVQLANSGVFNEAFSFSMLAGYTTNNIYETLYATALKTSVSNLSIKIVDSSTSMDTGWIVAPVPSMDSSSRTATFSDSAYSFNLAAGTTYTLLVTGFADKANSTLSIKGNYLGSITPVPEPESYAMLLAGLGLMGTIARRRSKKVS